LCNFLHSPVTSSILGPNILLNTLGDGYESNWLVDTQLIKITNRIKAGFLQSTQRLINGKKVKSEFCNLLYQHLAPPVSDQHLTPVPCWLGALTFVREGASRLLVLVRIHECGRFHEPEPKQRD
jgi:hypothetical protein